ncbi:MAG: D-aminoacylase [Bacteroidales bacterium]|nr:D-aminoacylase [Bacteroidales bacterium]
MSSTISRRKFIQSSLFATAAFGLGYASSGVLRANNRFDTIIKGGVIYNGEGGKPFPGEIGIKDGKISAIASSLGDSADVIIDAKGAAVSPGFVDIHTHTDGNLFESPLGDSKIYQGVTTEIGGNCGSSPFPTTKWESLGDFYGALSQQKLGLNFGTFTGQGDLRQFVVGDKDVRCTDEQLEQMKSILAVQMEQGSLGISCGLEYTPGSYASNEEIAQLCKVVAHYNGLFAIHMRNEDDRVEEAVAEAIEIAKKSGVRLQISHLKAQNAANWHKAPALLKQIERAASDGVDIAFDRYPYIAFSTGMSTFIPLSDRDGSKEEIIARLKDEAKSKKIGEYALSRIARLGGPANVVVTSCRVDSNKRFIGQNVEQCCQLTGKEPWPFIRDLLIEENVSVSIIGFAMTEENVKMFLSHPLAMPASDGSVYSPVGKLSQSMPHPRSYGTFPRFLGKYCREESLMDLSTAVKKCSSLPASRLGLKNRGSILPGYFADIVVFDPVTIIDTATFASPHQFATGINEVIVNGVWTLSGGVPASKRGGRIIKLGESI